MSGRGLNGLSLQQHRALSDAFDGVLGKDPIGWFCVGRLGRRYSGKTVYSLFCRDLVTPGEGVIHGRKRVDITAKGRKVLNGEEVTA